MKQEHNPDYTSGGDTSSLRLVKKIKEKKTMAYSPTYAGGDIASIVIDILGNVAVQAVAFASLIGLVIVYKWFQTGRLPF